eukprot:403368470
MSKPTNSQQAKQKEDQDFQNEIQASTSETPTSRLIVKNIPKHLDEQRLRLHFQKEGGHVTDAKIMKKGNKSRLFAFVGFKSEEEAEKAKKYFNNSYIDTSKVQVEFALAQNDPKLSRPWSRYSKGSSAFLMKNGKESNEKAKMTEEEKEQVKQEIENKKDKFRSFLKVMGMSKENKQSWNDSFTAFMADDGSGLQHTATEDKKKRKAKEEEKKNKKEEKEKKTKDNDEKVDEDKQEEKNEEDDNIIDEQRIYVMNLAFTINHEELREKFGPFGEIADIEIPLRKGGQSFGFAFIKYATVEAAVSAYAELDKTFYQGRKLHILPAQKKPPKEIPDFNPTKEGDEQNQSQEGDVEMKESNQNQEEQKQPEQKQPEQKEKIREKKSTFKEEKEKEVKENFDDETNWNYLFMNQDAVATSMASKLNISKGSLLDRDQKNLAVRVAKAETIIINQTKEWMKENGIDLDRLERTDRLKCKRSHTVIIVKNIPYHTKEQDIREVFERYGVLKRLLLSPFNTLALVEYDNEKQAKTAMKNLQNHKINYIMPIYLEYAPVIISKSAALTKEDEKKVQEKEVEEQKQQEDNDQKGERTIFVKNLNFSTVEEQLEQVFKEAKVGKILSCKIVKNNENQLSRGYGFVELESKEMAEKAIKKLQNFILDEHALKLSISKKDVTKAEKKSNDDQLGKRKEKTELSKVEAQEDLQSNKLLVKNLAFEATDSDIKELFKTYGALKKCRLPKKINSKSHRGFGFVEFVSSEEAKNAFKMLQHTHLYGRKIIIEWAKPEVDMGGNENNVDVEGNKNKRQRNK